MSSIWDCCFGVVGPKADLDSLKRLLLALKWGADGTVWHTGEVVYSLGYITVVTTSRNYGGTGAVDTMVAEFPNLTFIGSLWHLYDPDWSTFLRKDGVTTWQRQEGDHAAWEALHGEHAEEDRRNSDSRDR